MQSQSFNFSTRIGQSICQCDLYYEKKSENVVLFCLFRSMREAAKGGEPFTQRMTSTGIAIRNLLVTNTAHIDSSLTQP